MLRCDFMSLILVTAVSGGDKSDDKPLETEDLVRILLGSKGESADNSEHMEQNPKKYNY